jgi:hypothetical protein
VESIGEGFGNLFEGGEEQPTQQTERPAAAADYAYDGPVAAGKDFLTEWSHNPLSQALFAAGLATMASDRVNPFQAIGEGGLRGLQYFQSASEQERERQKDEAEAKAANAFQRQLTPGGGSESPDTSEVGTSAPPSRPATLSQETPETENVPSKAAEAENNIKKLMAEQERIYNIPVTASQAAQKSAHIKMLNDRIEQWRKYGAPSDEEKAATAAEKTARAEEGRQNRMNAVAEHKQLMKDFEESSREGSAAKGQIATIDHMIDKFKDFESGPWAQAKTEWATRFPYLSSQEMLDQAGTYQILKKESINQLFDQLKKIGGQIRVGEMNLLQQAMPDPALQPGAVKSILAKAKAIAKNAETFEDDRVQWAEANPNAGHSDYLAWKNKWLKEHDVSNIMKDVEKEIHVKGENVKKNEPSKSSSADSEYLGPIIYDEKGGRMRLSDDRKSWVHF